MFILHHLPLKRDALVSATHLGLLQGTCPLTKACSHNNWEAAELLIRHRVQVNNADKEVGTNLVHWSAANVSW